MKGQIEYIFDVQDKDRFQPTDLTAITGVPYLSHLEFESFRLYQKIRRKQRQLLKKDSIGHERLWLSAYFQKELLSERTPEVLLGWVDDEIGWGVFAAKDFAKMEFVTEYTGVVRGRKRGDEHNSYCFEYLLLPDEPTDFLIDAQMRGGISRYINHSEKSNLTSSMIVVDGVSHIILYTNQRIPKGTQLCYDYGPQYWKKRKKPKVLNS